MRLQEDLETPDGYLGSVVVVVNVKTKGFMIKTADNSLVF